MCALLALTGRSGVRPFGVSLLVAGWDENRGATLYQVDPSGSFWAWKASAIGKNQVNAKTFLEKRCAERLGVRSRRSFNDDISLEDAIHTALLTLKEGFEGQMTEKTIEIGIISGVSKSAQAKAAASADGADIPAASTELPTFRRLTEAEIRDYLAL